MMKYEDEICLKLENEKKSVAAEFASFRSYLAINERREHIVQLASWLPAFAVDLLELFFASRDGVWLGHPPCFMNCHDSRSRYCCSTIH